MFHVLLAVFIIVQIMAFIFYLDYGSIQVLATAGTVFWIISAILGWLPIYIFRKRAGVPKGSSYVKTTRIVTTGIYSVVRHPQYLGGMLFSLSLMLISQHWLVIALGIPVIIIFYLGGVDEDRAAVRKFGSSYEDYMKKVPRFNIILGILRRL